MEVIACLRVQLDCSAWQGHIAAALEASPSTPITPSLPQLTALLGPRTAEEEGEYAREASELAEQIFIGECMTEDQTLCLTSSHAYDSVQRVYEHVCQQHHQGMRLTDARQQVLHFAMAANMCCYTCTDARIILPSN